MITDSMWSAGGVSLKQIIRRIIIVSIFIVGLVSCYSFSYLLFQKPKDTVELSSVVKAAIDEEENSYILNESGNVLLITDPQDQINYRVDIGKKHGIGRDILVCNDTVYIHVIKKQSSGYRIIRDMIVAYSKDGDYIKTVYRKDYEEAAMVTGIKGMFVVNGAFAYIAEEPDAFNLYAGNNELIASYALVNAPGITNSYAVSGDGKEVYYCRLNGTIYRYVDGIHDTLIYDAATFNDTSEREFSVPRSIALDEKNTLYFTDIGRREIFRFVSVPQSIDSEVNEQYFSDTGEREGLLVSQDRAVPQLVKEYEDDTAVEEKDICYYISADRQLIGVTESAVKIYGEEIRYIYSLTYCFKYQVICVLNWILMIIDVLIILWMLYKLICCVIFKMSKYAKIALGAVGVICIISMIFMGIVMPPFKKLMYNQMYNQEQVLSESALSILDKEAFKAIHNAADFDSEEYDSVRKSMQSLFLNGNETTEDFYVQLWTIQREDIITTSYCLMEDTGAMYPYAWPYEGSDEQAILTSGEGRDYITKSSEGSYLLVLNPILDEEGNAIGLIEVGTDLNSFQTAYNSLLGNLIINVAGITVVLILMIIELTLFFEGKDKYKKASKNGKQVLLSNGLLRFVVFIIFFVTNLSTGFLPQYAMTLSSNHSHLPKEILAAIPISAEVVVGAIFSIWGTYVVEKIGEKRSAVLSSMGIVAGFALRLIPNVWILTLGNALIGAGWGIILLMVNTMIALKEDENEKESGFADYSAAALNGVNCGVVFGGLLTNWFSYRIIFIFSAMVGLLILYYTRRYMSSNIITQTMQSSKEEEEETSRISFGKFIFNHRIISYFLMIVIPVIACGYFLTYMFPILGAEYGMSDTNIGYSYLLNGICVICLSNVLTKTFSTKVDKRISLVISVLLYGVAFIIVGRYQNIYSILAALVLLGISDSFGLPIQTAYYTELDIVKKYGYDKAIGIYSLFENGAQALGSFVFSWVLIFGVGAGLRIVTEVIVTLSLGFILFSFMGRKKSKE